MPGAEFDFAALLEGETMRTWIRIMQWAWALGLLYILARLMRGGFTDLSEIAASRYATRRERFDALARMPARAVALALAALFGATTTAFGVWFQGAILIVIWRQISGAAG